MFHVKHPPDPPPGRCWELHGCNSGRSVKKDDDPARRLGALALAVHTVDGGHGVVHDLALAARFADRVMIMERGALVADGSAHKVLTPERIADVFGVEATITDSVVGPIPVLHSPT